MASLASPQCAPLADTTRHEKLNQITRKFALLHGVSAAAMDVPFPQGKGLLESFSEAYPDITCRLADLTDLAHDMESGSPQPLSNGSSTGTVEAATDDHLAQLTTEEELARAELARAQKARGKERKRLVVAELKRALGAKYKKNMKFTIDHDTLSSFEVVWKQVSKIVEPFQVMIELKQKLDEIDASFNSPVRHSAPSAQVVAAFESEYIGRAHERLFRYVEDCWDTFWRNDTDYARPYCAIMQSSGFGKSRALRELARMLPTVRSKRMHMLYLCLRDDSPGVSGYPHATKTLHGHFFPKITPAESDEDLVLLLTEKIYKAFTFIMRGEREVMDSHLAKLFEGKEGGLWGNFEHSSAALPLRTENKPHVQILAIDEAGVLLPTKGEPGIGWFRLLHQALIHVNKRIKTSGWFYKSGVCGIVVDTNSHVADFVPSSKQDRSSRPGERFRLFPPFVLTDTIDVLYAAENKIQRYQQDVLNSIKNRDSSTASSWSTLKLLGRPLWICSEDGVNKLSFYAARKLLLGKDPDDECLTDDTMRGVASVLCRAGLRPYSSSPLASRVVADFMAVLSHVGYEHDQFISSYSSDPALTLGAARIWHGIRPSALADTILPQFRKMLHQELMDTGGAGEMVARLVLLLVMDACGVLETGKEESRWSRVGEFASVWTFLTALHGDDPKLKQPVSVENQPPRKVPGQHFECVDESAEELSSVLEKMKADWKDWCVSFTHFVQLAEHPSEDCLWAMLARRAAGAFPRGQKGVDLVIPICTSKLDKNGKSIEARVSMIVVQVKNWENADSSFPMSATKGTRPSSIFKRGDYAVPAAKQAFQALKPDNVIRLYMSFGGDTERFYLRDDDSNGHSTFVLCSQGLSGWSIQPRVETSVSSNEAEGDEAESDEVGSIEVLSDDVATQLKSILRPWWNLTMVREDVRVRDEKKLFGMPPIDVMWVAKQPLAETLLFNDGKLGCLPSCLGRVDETSAGGDASAGGAGGADDTATASTTASTALAFVTDAVSGVSCGSEEEKTEDVNGPSPKKRSRRGSLLANTRT